MTISRGLSTPEWLGFGLLVGVLVYVEGYRALQRRFVPHVVARALDSKLSRPGIWTWVAPIHVMSLVGDESRAARRAWLGVLAIVAAVVLVRHLPETWRALVDGAVALALSWGLVALLVNFWAATQRPH